MKNKLICCFLAVIPLLITPIAQAKLNTQQCIVAPKRIYACDNLIYTSIKKESKNHVVCVCKPDKESILTLLTNDEIATQRIMIRKFVSKYQLSSDEIINIFVQIN